MQINQMRPANSIKISTDSNWVLTLKILFAFWIIIAPDPANNENNFELKKIDLIHYISRINSVIWTSNLRLLGLFDSKLYLRFKVKQQQNQIGRKMTTLPAGNLTLSISSATMLMSMIQMGLSSNSCSFLTKAMAEMHWLSNFRRSGYVLFISRLTFCWNFFMSKSLNGFSNSRRPLGSLRMSLLTAFSSIVFLT